MKSINLLALVVLLGTGSAFAQTKTDSNNNGVYMVQLPHTPKDCLDAITKIKDKGPEFLSTFEFGCASGDHTAYAFMNGASREEVTKMLPADAQAGAKITRVEKFTVAQIEQYHKEKGTH